MGTQEVRGAPEDTKGSRIVSGFSSAMKEISIFWSFVPSSVFLARQEQIWISFFKAMAEISSTEFEEIETSVFEITMASPYDHAYPFRLMVEEVPELLNRFLPREAGRSWLESSRTPLDFEEALEMGKKLAENSAKFRLLIEALLRRLPLNFDLSAVLMPLFREQKALGAVERKAIV